MSDMGAMEAHIASTDPALLAEFEAQYEPPTPDGRGDCTRCGVSVVMGLWYVHRAWHRGVSLQLYVFGSAMRTIASALDDFEIPAPDRQVADGG